MSQIQQKHKFISRKRLRKFLRYIIMFLSLFIATQYIPECQITYQTAFIMAAIASITFGIIDSYIPILCDQKFVSRKRFRKFLRYIIMFLSLFIITQYIPKCPITYQTSFIMSSIASVTFSIIDMYFPVLCE